jgi:hypothetical protein
MMKPSESSQLGLGLVELADAPVLWAWGMGVDSTAGIIEMVERGERIDQILAADTGAEKPKTYEFRDLFMQWLRDRKVPVGLVQYEPSNFKNFPPYRSLDENCLTNGTLPSISFGFSSCSQKWKITPQNKWTESWEPARKVWAAGGKVIKLIGYDAGPRDSKRYAEREGYDDPRYHYRYPLREWGWDRARCAERILAAGLPLPPKSACYMCAATKPSELHDLEKSQLRRIVLMEARAAPRLTTTEGLWRKAVKGSRGATPHPGAMTDYIRDQRLLPAAEIEEIIEMAPTALLAWQDAMGARSLDDRPDLAEWLRLFERNDFNAERTPALYGPVREAFEGATA